MITPATLTVSRLLENEGLRFTTKVPADRVQGQRSLPNSDLRYAAGGDAIVEWTAILDYSDERVVELYADVHKVSVPMVVWDLDDNPIEQTVVQVPPPPAPSRATSTVSPAAETGEVSDDLLREIGDLQPWTLEVYPTPSGSSQTLPYYPREIDVDYDKRLIRVVFE